MMKPLELVLGVILLLGSTYGYFHSSNLVVQTQNFINNSTPQLLPKLMGDPSSNFLHVSQSAMEKIIKVTQYGFIVLAVSGLVLLGYGAVAKKQNLYSAEGRYPN